MTINFDCGENFRTNNTIPCTREWFEKQIDSDATLQLCVMAEMGNESSKGLLPIVCLHASFKNGVRKNQDAVDSGLVMLDIDDKEGAYHLDPQREAEQVVERLKDYPEVLAVHVSASRHGLHVISKKVGMANNLAEQDRLFKELFPHINPNCFDRATKDMARAACLVPRSYFTFLNLDELFGGEWDERYVKFVEKTEGGTDHSATPSGETAAAASTMLSDETKSRISEDRQMYGDFLYSDIVEALDKELGNTGQKGSRHGSVMELCRNLAFICLDADHIESVLPAWALGHREYKACITSSITFMRNKQMPDALRRVLMRLEGVDEDVEQDEAPHLPKDLHPAIAACVAPFHESCREVYALISLAYLGTLGGCAKFRYRGVEQHYPGFDCCLIAEQTKGKSGMMHLAEDLLKPLYEEDDEKRRLQREYKDALIAAPANEQKPKDPHFGLRILNPKTTKPALFENITNNKGKRAIIIAPEVDSLRGQNNWCDDKGATERLSFDTEKDGQDTKTAQGCSAFVPMALNIVTSGTPMAIRNRYSNTEDGLATRIAICTFPSWYNSDIEEKERTEANKKKLAEIQQILMAEEMQEKPYVVNRLKEQQLEWCKNMGKVSDMLGNPAIEVFRKRAAVMGFRAGCLLWLLDGKKLTKKAMEFALWVSRYVMHYQLKFFGTQLNQSIEKNREVMQAKAPSMSASQFIFSVIPDSFTYKHVLQEFEKQGQKGSGYRVIVSRWKKNEWVECIGRGTFVKTALGKQVLSSLAA